MQFFNRSVGRHISSCLEYLFGEFCHSRRIDHFTVFCFPNNLFPDNCPGSIIKSKASYVQALGNALPGAVCNPSPCQSSSVITVTEASPSIATMLAANKPTWGTLSPSSTTQSTGNGGLNTGSGNITSGSLNTGSISSGSINTYSLGIRIFEVANCDLKRKSRWTPISSLRVYGTWSHYGRNGSQFAIGCRNECLCGSSLRKNEIMKLSWVDVDISARLLRIPQTKNGTPLTLPLDRFLTDIFRRRKTEFGGTYVFPGKSGSRPVRDIDDMTSVVVRASGVKFTLLDLRRTFATTGAEIGLSPYILKRLLNHKSGRHDVSDNKNMSHTKNKRRKI